MHRTHTLTASLILSCCVALFGCPNDVINGSPEAYEACSHDAIVQGCHDDLVHTGTYTAIDATMDDFLIDNDLQGCGLGLIYDGQIHYLKGYGDAWVADVSEAVGVDVPWGLDTFAPIGSSTKIMTAIMILQMIEQDRLPQGTTLQTPLSELLNDIDPDATPQLAALTLEQLLSHTTGIPQSNESATAVWMSDSNYFSDDANSVAELVALYDDVYNPHLHPSITAYSYKDQLEASILSDTSVGRYNNSNFRLAASVVDLHDTARRITCAYYEDEAVGMPWGAVGPNQERCSTGYEPYFRDFIANAPGEGETMTTMCLQDFDRYETLPTLARAYEWTDATPSILQEDGRSTNIALTVGSTGMMTTIGDFARFIVALDRGDLISEEMYNALLVPRSTVMGGTYGLGAWIITQDLPVSGAAEGLEAGGNTEGFSTWWRLVKPTNGKPSMGAVLACNTRVTNPRAALMTELLETLDADIAADIHPISDAAVEAAQCQSPPPQDAMASLKATWRDVLHQKTVQLLSEAGGDPDRAVTLARQALMREPEGRDLLAAYDRGDYTRAAQLLARVLSRQKASQTRR